METHTAIKNPGFAGSPGPSALQNPLAIKARESALHDFEGKFRKMPAGSGLRGAPYGTHVEAVAQRLAAAGFDAEVVAAAYLHDHLEDLPHLWTKDRLAQEFTTRVAELVGWVTELSKGVSWEERQEAYAKRLWNAPLEAVAISIADKTCNLLDSVEHLKRGYPLGSILSRGWKENSRKFHNLFPIFARRGPPQLMGPFVDALISFDRLGGVGES